MIWNAEGDDLPIVAKMSLPENNFDQAAAYCITIDALSVIAQTSEINKGWPSLLSRPNATPFIVNISHWLGMVQPPTNNVKGHAAVTNWNSGIYIFHL